MTTKSLKLIDTDLTKINAAYVVSNNNDKFIVTNKTKEILTLVNNETLIKINIDKENKVFIDELKVADVITFNTKNQTLEYKSKVKTKEKGTLRNPPIELREYL